MNILVTGGCGFIGANFIRFLFNDHEKKKIKINTVVNLDKLTYAGNPDNLNDIQDIQEYHFIHGDICDRPLLDKLFYQYRFTHVVHFAAESHVDRSIDSPEPFFQTNAIGTLRLVDTAYNYWKTLDEASKKTFRFLHISTDEVYGSLSATDPPFSETSPYAPNSPYAASKAASDFIVRSYSQTYGFPTLTTNCSNNYGPYQFPEKLIPLMVLNALKGKPLPIYGDGSNVRDWLHVEDHCRGIWKVLTEACPHSTYNIGGMNEVRNIDVVRMICAFLDELAPKDLPRPFERLITFVKDRPGHDKRYAIDCKKICTELGWKPIESFHTGLKKTVQWYLHNAAWCDKILTQKYNLHRLGEIK